LLSSSSRGFSGVGQIPNCSYKSKKLELVGGDLRLMLVDRERGSSTCDALLGTSHTACILGCGSAGKGEVGADDGSGGSELGEGSDVLIVKPGFLAAYAGCEKSLPLEPDDVVDERRDDVARNGGVGRSRGGLSMGAAMGRGGSTESCATSLGSTVGSCFSGTLGRVLMSDAGRGAGMAGAGSALA
jgi:hypothetical protein